MSKERGMANIRLVLTILFIALMIFAGVKLLPPYFYDYELQQDLESIARLATYAQNRSVGDIKGDVVQKAKEDDVSITPDDVEVQRTASGVNIEVKYSVMISVFGKAHELKFNPKAGNKNITAR